MSHQTTVSIDGGSFCINGRPTYAGRAWRGMKIEGLLMNARLVQGIFDDLNPATRAMWDYSDGPWDPERNTREFLAAMPKWRAHGLISFTLNLQGGSPQGYSREQPWHNSAFTSDGSLRVDYMSRLERILDRADELGMTPILGLFYFGQTPRLDGERAIVRATENAVDWLLERRVAHVLIEIANECDVRHYTQDILKPPRAHELIRLVQERSSGRVNSPAGRLLVSTSFSGGAIPTGNVVEAADFLLIHGNGVGEPARIRGMVDACRALKEYRGRPILFNEDDHFDFDAADNHLLAAVSRGAGWGYFDYRMRGEGFDEGFQSVPVNWTINSARKRGFFGLLVVMTAALALAVSPLFGAPPAAKWEPLGLSGAGGMFTPAISPVNPKLMMLNCDMSAAYLSRDGGLNWTMIHQSQLRTSTACRPAFHPKDANVIFAAQAGAGLKASRDGGETWTPVPGTPRSLRGEIAIDPGQPDRMMIGDVSHVLLSEDGGKAWRSCNGPTGETVAFFFDQTSPADKRVIFAATSGGLWRSDDGGSSWAEKTRGLPSKEIRSFSGGSRVKDKLVVLYCVVPSKSEGGRFSGGVFRSTDRGETWQSAMGAGINVDTAAADPWAHNPVCQYHWVLTTDADPNDVWTFNSNTGVRPPHHATAYRSADGGRTWRATFYPDPRFKECNVEPCYVTVTDGQYYQSPPFGVAVSPADPDEVIMVQTEVYVTTNGGRGWRCGHTRRAGSDRDKEARWSCNGLVITSTWNYYVDPFQPARHYICYTDIGFARSLDAGKSWSWWDRKGRSPWGNTCYELAFDPKVPGRVWGAFSNTHDIPNGNIIWGSHRANYPGGVCLSTDFAATWHPVSSGLPEVPALSIVVDPKSPPGRRTLYASMFGEGVYKSVDDAQTWRKASAGLGAPENVRTCRLQLHPDGTLFVLITAMRKDGKFLSQGAGLWRSKDGAKTWEQVNRSRPLLWPKDFTVDPSDSRIIYVGAADAGADQAGLWRTTDGGETWKLLARKGSEHFGAYLHPKRPGWIYMTLCEGPPASGLWLSKDNGETWSPMSLPFSNVQRVTVDPANPDVIYVTTFGGSVWKGPSTE